MTSLCLTAPTRPELDAKLDEQLDRLDSEQVACVNRGCEIFTPHRPSQHVAVIWLDR